MKPIYQHQSPYSKLQLALAATLLTLLAFSSGAGATTTNTPNPISPGNGPSHSVSRSTTALQNLRSAALKPNVLNAAVTGSARPTNQRVVAGEVGPNHRSWTKIAEDAAPAAANQLGSPKNPGGSAVTRNAGSQVVEITTGMNFWDGQQWSPSDATFDLTDDSFIANRVQHRTRLSAELNVVGAVTTTLQDGTMLRSTPVAIALYDPNDGRFAVISTLTNSTGILVASNQVLYPDAFSGGVCASVIYTLEKGSFEQDVVISGRLNPLDYSFPTNAQIQVVTEFYDAPQPEKMRRPVYIEENESVRRRKVSPDLVDEVLGFSDLVFGTGRAYTMPSAENPTGTQSVVAKEFKTDPKAGRAFLIEAIDCLPIQKALNSLPECAEGVKTAQAIRNSKARDGHTFIPKPNPRALVRTQPIRSSTQLAQVENLMRTGVVVDYFATLGTPLSSGFVFKGDTTYLVAGTVYCNGPVTLEAAVLKYKTGATIKLNNVITCKTSSYRPAVFTCLDDESVGESVAGLDSDWTGTINPAGYANPAIWSYYQSAPSLSNVRICYAQEAVRLEGTTVNATVSFAQIIKCIRGIVLAATPTGSSFNVTVNDTLMAIVPSALIRSTVNNGYSATVSLYHCTVDQSQVLANGTSATPNFQVTFKNSVLANIGALGNASFGSSTYNGFSTCPLFGATASRWSATDQFQVAGGGAYYLKADSVFRGKGTTVGLPATLLPALKTRSTQPPIAFPRFMEVTGELTLFPQIPRYVSGAPDLGYYYDALDYTMAAMQVEGGTINVLPGTAIGFRQEFAFEEWLQGSWPWGVTETGMNLWKGSSLISHGTPTRPNIFADVQLVQETGVYPVSFMFVPDRFNSTPDDPSKSPPVLDFRFCNFHISSDWYHLVAGDNFTWSSAFNLSLRDCSLFGGWYLIGKNDTVQVDSPCSLVWVNNLFDRVKCRVDPDWLDSGDATLYVDLSVEARNNLFRWGTLMLVPTATAGNWKFTDNLFDKEEFLQDTSQILDHDFNAYWPLLTTELRYASSGGTPRLSLNGANDRILTSAPAYQTSQQGNYYLPTSYYLPTGSGQSGYVLRNAGSRTVAIAGLAQYTTSVNQTKENKDLAVTIGLHYVATANSTSTQPKDSETPTPDGIPDYVEDQNGNGVVDNNETNPAQTMTDGVHADKANAIYDDIDLDGDGMVGRIEKVLSPLCTTQRDPLIPDNPLVLTQVVTPGEHEIIKFGIPINHDLLSNVGSIKLYVDGISATLQRCDADQNGNCLLVCNSTYESPWNHLLSAVLKLHEVPDEALIRTTVGPMQPFYSDNIVQFFVRGAIFDQSEALLYAQLPQLNADYTIRLYDPASPAIPIKTITGSTSTGEIEEHWVGLIKDTDSTPFGGEVIKAVFELDDNPVKNNQLINKGETGVQEGAFNVAFMSEFSELTTPNTGAMWLKMQNIVDVLMMQQNPGFYQTGSFNNPTGGGAKKPGFVDSRAKALELLDALPQGRNFFSYSHGGLNVIANKRGTADIWLKRQEVQDALGNNVVDPELGFKFSHRYRFVFMYGCGLGGDRDWPFAFGIGSPDEPQAFAGFIKDVGLAATAAVWNDSPGENPSKGYGTMLTEFFANWRAEIPLASCIEIASDRTKYKWPLPVWSNKDIYGKDRSSHIGIYGNPKLKRTGVAP